MSKTILRAGATAVLAIMLFAPPVQADEPSAELKVVRGIVSEKFAQIEPEDIFESPVEGWYTVRKGAVVAYLSGDGRYLLQGDMIDLQTNSNLSEKSRNEARALMMSGVPDEDVIVFKPENPEYIVSVFTDIDCTFCRRLHSQIDEYMAEGIEIRYFLYPRNGPTSPSWAKAENVWCADDRNEALTLAKQDQPYDTHSCDSSIVSTHYGMGQDVGLRGTPAIVLEDGTLLSGYLPADRLKRALQNSGS